MTKTFILLFTLFIVDIAAIAQNNYDGKYYLAEISVSCEKTRDGGCMLYNYCVLKFEKDSVTVSYPQKVVCTPNELENSNSSKNNLTKRYKWTVVSDKLVINDFEDFNKYAFKEENENYIKTLYPQTIATEGSSSITKSDKLLLKGIVMSKNSHEILPSATIGFQNNKAIVTGSDIDGKFILTIPNNGSLLFPDTLQINYLGYDTKKIAIHTISELKNIFSESSILYLNESANIFKEEYGPPKTPQKIAGSSIDKVSDKQIRKKKKLFGRKNK